MKTVLFIRHGSTAGNLERRYIGRTDEELCQLGIEQVQALKGLQADVLFVSPMTRTRQSAALIFPGMAQTLVQDLRETDFGIFEALTADELATNMEYRNWVDSNCEGPIPGGEAVSAFKARCVAAFQAAIETVADGQTAAFVIHGGCIMAILEALACPKQDFYAYHIGNGRFLTATFDGKELVLLGK